MLVNETAGTAGNSRAGSQESAAGQGL